MNAAQSKLTPNLPSSHILSPIQLTVSQLSPSQSTHGPVVVVEVVEVAVVVVVAAAVVVVVTVGVVRSPVVVSAVKLPP